MAITAGYTFKDGEETTQAKKLNLAFSGAAAFTGAFNGTVGATTPSTGVFTTVNASGAITAAGGVTLTGGNYVTGSVFYSAVLGTTVVGKAGSLWDLNLSNPTGSGTYLNVPTGTLNCVFGAAVTATTGFGCNGAGAQTAFASGGALAAYGAGANGFDTAGHAQALYAMVVAIRAALVADGIMS